ncbi:hypothetical protein INS49_004178 [Diaporthe citri]|uniref:uncharacterized protein n=1 Tax=Diaporthe citri TaxID=83186 RepID=UPI001C81E87D|nr:uncharacterized protein INS49_004178 [Diaporthe citri]KAG6355097.1 hypothetical protein INS49_004178 [Diaporthe citri]
MPIFDDIRNRVSPRPRAMLVSKLVKPDLPDNLTHALLQLFMSPRSKRRRTGDRCHGTGCGQPDCGDCHRDEDADAGQQPLHTTGPAQPSPPTQSPSPGLAAMIAALEEKALRDLLLQSAASSQEIQRSIKDAYQRQVARPQPPPLLPQPLLSAQTTRPAVPLSQMRPVTNFDHYSKSAWHALNDRELLGLSGSRQYTMAGDVYSDICDCVNAIDEMTKDDAPLGTKQNAIETLRKIAKTIILGEDTVGYEVRKELQNDSHISEIMIRITESMTPEERLRTGRKADAKGTLISKLEWVRDEAEGHCLKDLEGFGRVLELMKTGFASTHGSSTAPIDLTS